MEIKNINEWNPYEDKSVDYSTVYLHEGEKGFVMKIKKEDLDQLKTILDNNNINYTERSWDMDLPF